MHPQRILGFKENTLPYGRMAEVKKCSNCSRLPQPIVNFVNEKGRECSTCEKCRTKGKKYDVRPERRAAHNELQRENRYDIAWRAKQVEERPAEYRAHNNSVHSAWRAENSERSATWHRTNVNPRLDAIKRSATRREIEWHLNDDEAKKMLVMPCVYCAHLNLEVRVNGIDRLDSSKGYTTENCRPCCKDCNYMKGTYDPLTFIERARLIASCTTEFPAGIQRCEEQKKINRVK